MHNNYHFFQHLVPWIEDNFKDAVVSECFSQNKNELVLGFTKKGKPLYIKCSLSPEFCCLYFPDQFKRARKNSVDLFEEIIDRNVTEVILYPYERSFGLRLEGEMELLFKMHGNRSNIILFQSGKVVKIFNNRLKGDLNLDPKITGKPPLDQSAFTELDGNLKKAFPTFGKVPELWLKEKNYPVMNPRQKWKLAQSALKIMEEGRIHITRVEAEWKLSLLPIGDIKSTYHNPVEALNHFYVFWQKTHQIEALRKEVTNILGKIQAQTAHGLEKSKERVWSLNHLSKFKKNADLLMANLHRIEPGAASVLVDDFYNSNQPLEIPLKKDKSPQELAGIWYQKAKNQIRELEFLTEQIKKREAYLEQITTALDRVRITDDTAELESIKSQYSKNSTTAQEAQSLPYHKEIVEGYEIRVGKNAKANDLLTFKFGAKNDLWLHARDVSGSHVIIKEQPGKKVPNTVISRAASLAAFYSKRKNDSICPVIVTQRKFVRKRKGDPPGAVVVDREEVIMVVPEK